MRNEAALQTITLAWLRGLPDSKWENRAPGPFTSIGVSDIIGCYRGRYVAIELKNPNEHHAPGPSDKRWPAQKMFLQSVFMSGGIAIATNNLETIKTTIWDMKYSDVRDRVSRLSPLYLESFI